jgi:hypothetical protein
VYHSSIYLGHLDFSLVLMNRPKDRFMTVYLRLLSTFHPMQSLFPGLKPSAVSETKGIHAFAKPDIGHWPAAG